MDVYYDYATTRPTIATPATTTPVADLCTTHDGVVVSYDATAGALKVAYMDESARVTTYPTRADVDAMIHLLQRFRARLTD